MTVVMARAEITRTNLFTVVGPPATRVMSIGASISYYFREGFERGYQDGYNSQSRYGTYSGGRWSILGTILNGILNLRSY
jgi:hypothetical protein